MTLQNSKIGRFRRKTPDFGQNLSKTRFRSSQTPISCFLGPGPAKPRFGGLGGKTIGFGVQNRRFIENPPLSHERATARKAGADLIKNWWFPVAIRGPRFGSKTPRFGENRPPGPENSFSRASTSKNTKNPPFSRKSARFRVFCSPEPRFLKSRF